MNTLGEFEEIGKIDETRTLRVSQRGDGLYLYLPKKLVEIYDLVGGDMVKAKLMEHLREERLIKKGG